LLPACKQCGCNALREIKRGKTWGGGIFVKYGCSACGESSTHTLHEDMLEAKEVVQEYKTADTTAPDGVVRFIAPLAGGATCPACGKHPVPVVSSGKSQGATVRVRYHKCPCGWSGRSEERVA
jgi:ssDNA-binding Zn-finger/Zn-ribbon topoisomerase 1